ncbi:cryptochrome/photolyase family protein [Paenimyroides aestuarii]|uniref:DNA photolyase family protein n=1 Tax=Paenimyroides aestuarii TaxID=2968490 RepID=A0ABY5NU74_9FLAO|nr:deoxyribodipyrimidine photo-lyase [Paenimyroides aestuarii]UUV22003.1 DNA photolyase family protein [Paenimyroides aestuarii]
MKTKVNIFWFRRDLRLYDNAGLSAALGCELPVLPVFIFDTSILNALPEKQDRRVHYIHQAITNINADLEKIKSGMHTFYSSVLEAFEELTEQYDIQAVFCNRDYEPQAIKRDALVADFLAKKDISFYTYKDQVIFEQNEVTKDDGKPYTVYTPYSKKWRSKLTKESLKTYALNTANFHKTAQHVLSLEDIGFKTTDFIFEKPVLEPAIINDYDKYRDFPALQHTTQLGTALRFGTISIRKCVAFAMKHNDVWLSELIWREFFMQILYHFPHVVHQSFKEKYDHIAWRNNEAEFKKWCNGQTGYPIVDAGMRQLNQTGFMHNRVRMIVASFLCKHLLIDWRWGEAYFAEKLNDYDLAANNGNWQWAAGCGCDAAPYFRIFNPTAQTQKFDKKLAYIKKWNPDFETNLEPPIVVHEQARERALSTYKKALQQET